MNKIGILKNSVEYGYSPVSGERNIVIDIAEDASKVKPNMRMNVNELYYYLRSLPEFKDGVVTGVTFRGKNTISDANIGTIRQIITLVISNRMNCSLDIEDGSIDELTNTWKFIHTNLVIFSGERKGKKRAQSILTDKHTFHTQYESVECYQALGLREPQKLTTLGKCSFEKFSFLDNISE